MSDTFEERWRSLFAAFDIEPDAPDALTRLATHVALELSKRAPEEFPQFAIDIPDAKTFDGKRTHAYAHWIQDCAILEEMDGGASAAEAARKVHKALSKAGMLQGVNSPQALEKSFLRRRRDGDAPATPGILRTYMAWLNLYEKAHDAVQFVVREANRQKQTTVNTSRKAKWTKEKWESFKRQLGDEGSDANE